MKKYQLTVTNREGTGRSASRRLRKAEKIPAILYGKHTKPESLAVGMVRTSASYYSLRVTTAPGVRQGGDRERRPSFPSCCRPPPLLPVAYQLFRRFSCAHGCDAQPMPQ